MDEDHDDAKFARMLAHKKLLPSSYQQSFCKQVYVGSPLTFTRCLSDLTTVNFAYKKRRLTSLNPSSPQSHQPDYVHSLTQAHVVPLQA